MKRRDLKSSELITHYLQGTCSAEEKVMVDLWYESLPEKELDLSVEEIEEDLNKVYRKLFRVYKKRFFSIGYREAAAALLIFGWISFYFIPSNHNKVLDVNVSSAEDVAPGKNEATLVLMDGRKILLSKALNGPVAEQPGVIISKSSDGKLIYHMQSSPRFTRVGVNTLYTARGEQYQMTLPDGTKVWLNAASSLKFSPTFLISNQRKVELSGEAYFEVTKNKKQPFIVKTKSQQITVLGTRFNISDYENESGVITTLIEGSIIIDSKYNTRQLEPGQQAALSDEILVVSQVDTETALGWKNGLFIFQDEPLQSIMRKLERWYDLQVEYDGVNLNEKFGGSISRYDHVSKVLKKLELAGGIHFKIEGRRVTAMK
ncbi:anti-sigma factor [Pedobacter sp. KBW06]|uniref:FecR family protein n=1 Tax=Pedobacter sp. KBW06 TaxID=2153359 RepID=UPI000F5AE97E|nr:FecR family protein [Pedobacter sp. KBW06]RQO75641.1 anti-sigma factor [Pedobacter sp. KBW06]